MNVYLNAAFKIVLKEHNREVNINIGKDNFQRRTLK